MPIDTVPQQQHVETLYCDDIRHEVNGKLSFIGVYQGRLIAQSLPITLPKLCIAITVRSPIDKLPHSLNLQVRKNEGDPGDEGCEEVLQEFDVPEEQLQTASEGIESTSEFEHKDRIQAIRFLLTFSPLQLDKPCLLRVYVKTDSQRIRGPALVVQEANQKEEVSEATESTQSE